MNNGAANCPYEDDVKRLTKDMYYGNGKPGMTTRVLDLEKSMDAIKFYGRWLIIMVGGVLVTSVVGLVIRK